MTLFWSVHASHCDHYRRRCDKKIGTGAMQKFAEFHIKPGALKQYGLPDIPYPGPAGQYFVLSLSGMERK
jgi:hypothetical protein